MIPPSVKIGCVQESWFNKLPCHEQSLRNHRLLFVVKLRVGPNNNDSDQQEPEPESMLKGTNMEYRCGKKNVNVTMSERRCICWSEMITK